MKKRTFLIKSLAAAGLIVPAANAAIPRRGQNEQSSDNLYDVFGPNTKVREAQHRSHQSHASHRSSSGGGSIRRRTTPTPAPSNSNSTAPSSILPQTSTPPVPLTKFQEVVKRVQLGLFAYGYYSGAIDGNMGPETKAALMKYQKDFELQVTGTITPGVLNAFNIEL